jgi:peptide/nickel transport system ATP-binding protein
MSESDSGKGATPLPLLTVEGLDVRFASPGSNGIRVIDGISFTVKRGEVVGIVGESGSGKSMTALSILRLLPPTGRVAAGRILLEETDLLSLPERDMRSIRGRRIAMIFQDPMTSLNPVFTAGEQIAEAVRHHRGRGRRDAWKAAVEALAAVHVSQPERRARQFPHELSGGMRQRVMIAIALACEPDLLIADEPTTALDVTVQAQILALIAEMRRATGMGVLLITHDLGVVAETCDRVLVMYAGQSMESAHVNELFASPAHPYTQGLLASLPERVPAGTRRLPFIPGQPPASGEITEGCPFRARCPRVMPGICERPLPTTTLGPNHVVRCHLYPATEPVKAAIR